MKQQQQNEVLTGTVGMVLTGLIITAQIYKLTKKDDEYERQRLMINILSFGLAAQRFARGYRTRRLQQMFGGV